MHDLYIEIFFHFEDFIIPFNKNLSIYTTNHTQ